MFAVWFLPRIPNQPVVLVPCLCIELDQACVSEIWLARAVRESQNSCSPTWSITSKRKNLCVWFLRIDRACAAWQLACLGKVAWDGEPAKTALGSLGTVSILNCSVQN